MATFLIGYDLNRPNRDDAYADLFAAIKAVSDGRWWHHLDSTWIIHSNRPNETAILEDLLPHIDDTDEILVVKLTGTGAWYGFNQKGSAWLKQNL